jgi:hypothetical protein
MWNVAGVTTFGPTTWWWTEKPPANATLLIASSVERT